MHPNACSIATMCSRKTIQSLGSFIYETESLRVCVVLRAQIGKLLLSFWVNPAFRAILLPSGISFETARARCAG